MGVLKEGDRTAPFFCRECGASDGADALWQCPSTACGWLEGWHRLTAEEREARLQGKPMMKFDTDMEKQALDVARKRVGAALEQIGFDKPPIDWRGEDAMAIVEAAVGGFRWEMARLSKTGEVPF